MKSSYVVIAVIAPLILLFFGCVHSLLPWLDSESIIPCNTEWTGEWWVDVADSTNRNRVVIELKKEEFRSGIHMPERYQIDVYTSMGLKIAQLRASLHELNGIKLLQIGDLTRQKELDVASITSFSLWRIEGNRGSLILWVPEFIIDALKQKEGFPVKTVRAGHELEQPIFVDTTEKLKVFLDGWTKNYTETKQKMPLILHRKGKPFKMPENVQIRK